MEVNLAHFRPHAILDEWAIVGLEDGRNVAVGYIYNDTKGRYPNGMWVQTSSIVVQAGDRVQTRNTQYMLGNPAEAGPADMDDLMEKFKGHW